MHIFTKWVSLTQPTAVTKVKRSVPKQPPQHILQECPDLAKQREDIWPNGDTLQEMLWITDEDLKHTVLFMNHAETFAEEEEKKLNHLTISARIQFTTSIK